MQLYWRLVRDGRVSVWPKALLLLSVLYVLSPVDIIPDVIPFVGEVDDLVVVIAACRLFIYLCPPDVVREHVRRIDAGASTDPPVRNMVTFVRHLDPLTPHPLPVGEGARGFPLLSGEG